MEHGEQVASQHHCRFLTPEVRPQVQKLSEIVTAIFFNNEGQVSWQHKFA
jgi:hypothetical protein